MPSTYTARLRLEKQAAGENDTTWGDKANLVFDLIDEALSGYLSIAVAGTGDYTLTALNSVSDESRQGVINLTGLLTGARNIIVPTAEGTWFFVNATTGAFSLTVKTAAGTGIAVPQGFGQRLFCDGTNVLAAGPPINTADGDLEINAIPQGAGSGLDADTLDGVQGSGYQAADADLTALAAVTIAADQMIYGTGAATWGTTTITLQGRQLLDDTSFAAMLTTLGAAADADVIKQGKHTIWVPAAAMFPTVTSGCSSLVVVEVTTPNRVNLQVLDFDNVADEHAQFSVAFPKSWNKGTITYQVFWTTTPGSTNGVAWALQGTVLGDDEVWNNNFGTAVVQTDNGTVSSTDLFVSAESSAVTLGGGTPLDDELTFFRIFRDVSDAGDTLAQDARLIGIKIFYTIDAADDS